MKQFPLDAGEREDRQVHHRDDADAEHKRTTHLVAGGTDDVEPFAEREQATQLALAAGQAAQAVLHNDHRTVDDDPEVDRAEAHQVAADAGAVHPRRREQHRKRDGQRGEKRGAKVAEQPEEHGDHQCRPVKQIVRHGINGGIHQPRAVEHGPDGDARRQAALHLGQLLRRRLGHGAAVCAGEHHRRADHGFAPVYAGAAEAHFAAKRDFRHVADANRRAVDLLHHDVRNGRRAAEPAARPHQRRRAVALDVARAEAEVVALQRGGEVVECQPVRAQRPEPGQHVILFHVTADGVDVGHERNGLDLRPDDPVLHRAEESQALDVVGEPLAAGRDEAARLAKRLRLELDRPHEHLAKPGGDRPHPGLDPRRQRLARSGEPLVDLLPRKIDVHRVVEHRRDLAKTVS